MIQSKRGTKGAHRYLEPRYEVGTRGLHSYFEYASPGGRLPELPSGPSSGLLIPSTCQVSSCTDCCRAWSAYVGCWAGLTLRAVGLVENFPRSGVHPHLVDRLGHPTLCGVSGSMLSTQRRYRARHE